MCRASIDEVQLPYPKAVFNFEISGDLDSRFDPARFQQVLSNLLTNAAKYSDEGKQITLSARRNEETIIVEVKNFGRPIPPESLQVIFNPLVQLSAQGSRSHPSTSLGLGLFIARNRRRTQRHDRGELIGNGRYDIDGPITAELICKAVQVLFNPFFNVQNESF